MPRLLPGAIVALSLSACASTPGVAENLDGTEWKLVSADGGALASLAADSGITLQFSSDRITGQGGCNRYNGSYTLTDARLSAGPVAATKMACDRMAAERAWFHVLSGPLVLQRDGDRLVLRDAGGVSYIFDLAATVR